MVCCVDDACADEEAPLQLRKMIDHHCLSVIMKKKKKMHQLFHVVDDDAAAS
jgi:hypothetical protein